MNKTLASQLNSLDGRHQRGVPAHVRRVVYPVERNDKAWVEPSANWAAAEQKAAAVLPLPYVVVHRGSEHSVSRDGGKIGAGYAQRVAMQLRHGFGADLLQMPAVVNLHRPATSEK